MELIPEKLDNLSRYVAKKYHQILLKMTSCDLCGQACNEHLLLCQHCAEDLPYFKQSIIDNDLLNWPAIHRALPQIAFDHLFCLAPYTTPFSEWLAQLKYSGRFEIAELFAELLSKHYLAQTIAKEHVNQQIDGVVCVPLHISKWQERGYNQAHLITQKFSKLINKPYLYQLISRTRKTANQVGQSGPSRRKNMNGAFTIHLKGKAPPQHLLLLDDVVTTGTTASEISRGLKRCGVKKVTVIAVCLTLPYYP